MSLGIGAIIGAGIFVLTGAAAANYAGPSIALSFRGWRNCVCLRRSLLCRNGVDGADRRQRLYVRLRHDG
jgi:hypothetical protein